MARKRRKSKLALPVGILTIILAIIGLIAVVYTCVNFVQSKKEKTELKAQYEEFLKPIVMFDPDPFDDLTQADKSQLMYCAVWNLLLDEEGMSKYPYSEGDTFGIQVPQEDIEASFITLFGTEIDPSTLHSEVAMSAYDITYDSALKSYIIPITGVESAYSPKVYDIQTQGDSIILTVGYIGNRAWADIGSDSYESPEPDKYMTITLRDHNGSKYVSAIQEADAQEIASMVSTSATVYSEVATEPVSETETSEVISESETQSVQYETVTDENGEVVTDEGGEPVTSVVETSDVSDVSDTSVTDIPDEMTVY